MSKITTRIMLFIILLMTCLSCSKSNKTILLDGFIDTEEWKDAEEHQLNDGNKLLIQKDGSDLYIALIANKKIWSHLYLSDDKTTIVMHASAALDAINYTKTNSLWRTKDDFKYEMRDTIYNKELEQKITEYYTINGWVANNTNLGNGKTIEFKVDISQWKNSLFLASAIANMDMTIHSFPLTVKDHTVLPKLVQGYAVDSLNFKPTTWFKIR